jgi:hypothetical protein
VQLTFQKRRETSRAAGVGGCRVSLTAETPKRKCPKRKAVRSGSVWLLLKTDQQQDPLFARQFRRAHGGVGEVFLYVTILGKVLLNSSEHFRCNIFKTDTPGKSENARRKPTNPQAGTLGFQPWFCTVRLCGFNTLLFILSEQVASPTKWGWSKLKFSLGGFCLLPPPPLPASCISSWLLLLPDSKQREACPGHTFIW